MHVMWEGQLAEMVGIILEDEHGDTLIALRLEGHGLILKLVHPSTVSVVE